jgi:3-deoxy-manno-octulosonate cytidylyltransferase (CMP-KDO synthetase)
MTGDASTGTDRVLEAVEHVELSRPRYELVVNVQGDEPLVNPDHIDKLVQMLRKDTAAVMSTIATPIRDNKDVLDPDVVKCVVDCNW